MIRFLSVVSLALGAMAAFLGLAAPFGVFALVQGTASQESWMWTAGSAGAAVALGVLARITQGVVEDSDSH